MLKSLATLVNGELQQMSSQLSRRQGRLQRYVDKSFNKTASLMALSCKSVAQAATEMTETKTEEHRIRNQQLKKACYEFGRNLGIAFQLTDDMLDFTAETEKLGKVAGVDMT